MSQKTLTQVDEFCKERLLNQSTCESFNDYVVEQIKALNPFDEAAFDSLVRRMVDERHLLVWWDEYIDLLKRSVPSVQNKGK